MRGSVLAAVFAAVSILASGCAPGSGEYDKSFDTRVAHPAHRPPRPVVVFDATHREVHRPEDVYKPFADLLSADGCDVRPSITRLDDPARTLGGVHVLVIAGARGTNDAEDEPAFSDAECAAVEAWVRDGGSLLLVTDHWPYGSAARGLAERFGVTMGAGLVEDSTQHDPERGLSHLVFSEENGLLRDHPIVRGRSPEERVRRVLTFTGQSIAADSNAVAFLALSNAAIEYPPAQPRVHKQGKDVRVEMEYGDPVSAAGHAQGIAFEFGKGRVVVLGEAGMFRAQRESKGTLVGMNAPGYDNRQLALNVMRWLTRAL